jgi:hypothetical protein
MKKVICLLLILIIVGIGTGYWLNSSDKLVTSTLLLQHADDFLVHVQVEEAKDGVKVLHSIQYVGEKEIEMLHKEPLISVSIDEAQHHFTGESTIKRMSNGAIYPQQEVVVPVDNKGVHHLYIHAQFMTDGEEVNIEHVEELTFQ